MENKDFIIEDDVLVGHDVLTKCINKSIVNAVIPEGVSAIGEGAFEDCTFLESISIPNGVTSIGDDAFRECHSLVSISIPASVANIGYTAFYLCKSLVSIDVDKNNKDYASIDGVLYDKKLESLICCPAKKEGHYDIPSSVIEIDEYAFCCSKLTSVNIPSSIEEIPAGAFLHCSLLKEIVIPDSVTSLNTECFRGCSSLSSVVIPKSVTFIDEYAFEGCLSLKSITFKGNKEEWNSIEKVFEWNLDSSIKIIKCSDGDVYL